MENYTQTPAGIPPAGVSPNFIDPPSLSVAYQGVIYSFVPLMFMFLVCRLYVRVRMLRNFGLDDGACKISQDIGQQGTFGSIIAYCGVLIPLLDHPLGRHLWDVPMSEITDRYLKARVPYIYSSPQPLSGCFKVKADKQATQYSTVILVAFFLSALFVKLGLLFFYFRLFQIYRLAYWLIWAGVGAVSAFYLISTVLLLDRCVPRQGQTWLETTYTGSCTPVQNGLSKGSGIFGLISDLYILAVPLWFVSQLRLPTKRKLGVSAVFLTGIFSHRNNDASRTTNRGKTDELGKLPDIPQSALTRLRSFIRRANWSRAHETELERQGDGSVLLTQDSAFQNYHHQLKAMYSHDVEKHASSDTRN
ncbi:hypothetical protein MAC_08707 [Metarhizium acridum CQMa 102]|uniref:Rhodopsin domain-containing protein n=1 Tax=Metarhizium acridum (strain CQMa 102) TaxID=655827 RepID=E9EFQ9_METAQ|nr:uncharacterized protein MAC_08707 [Metarhizium acridum CQMa 102]EFY85247.1 hypothetical protein MAC_08707 [Metarhizium acridum CQMa 102]